MCLTIAVQLYDSVHVVAWAVAYTLPDTAHSAFGEQRAALPLSSPKIRYEVPARVPATHPLDLHLLLLGEPLRLGGTGVITR